MSHYAVHAPWSYPDHRFTNNYPQLKGHGLAFATLVEGMDKSLGDIMQKLDDLGVGDETLIIVVSNNGSAWSSGAPFRDKKGSRFEGGLRVPLIVSWARRNARNPLQKAFPIPANSVEHGMVTCVDLMPTMLKLAGAKVPSQATIDGHDIRPYFLGTKGVHRPREFLAHFPHRHRNTLYSTYRKNEWKIIFSYEPDKWELYNLNDDPFEKANLDDRQPRVALILAKEMVEKLDSMDARYPQSVAWNEDVNPNIGSLVRSSKP